MRHRFFTLIEMLVVIAIISILASMLSPSLMKALESARAVACVNNLKQSGLALATYSGDFNGWIPGSQIYLSNPWTTILTDVAPRGNVPQAGNYIGDPLTFYCPSAYVPEKGYRSDDNGWWSSWLYTYGMINLTKWSVWQKVSFAKLTDYRSNDGNDKWTRLGSLPRPGMKCLVGDTIHNDQGERYARKQQIFEWGPGAPYSGWSLHERHLSKVNLWFADGHGGGVDATRLGDKETYDVQYVSLASGGEPFKLFD